MEPEKIFVTYRYHKEPCYFQCSSILTERVKKLRVVALGGGTGLPVVLKSIKTTLFPLFPECFGEHDSDKLTAIATVTNDGVSSGKLRRDFGIKISL